MAEEANTSPVSAAEPPKANPLAAPAAKTAATLQMKPLIRKPVIGGAGGALKPGLKLPPKPGAAAGASPLKTVSTASPLKPGIKLPAAPALKPGIKLPTKPVIRKPGTGVAPAPLKPAVPAAPKPAAAPVAAAPAPAPAAAPVAPVAAKPVAPVAAPVVAKPISAEPPKSALGALKAVTQNLKNVAAAAEAPQQAVLHKTGIVAAPVAELTDAQKQAAKSKTARISLSEAVGVAPVKNENAPMKTIRIKRPTDIQSGGPAVAKPAAPVAAAVVAAPVAAPAAAPAEKSDVSVTQRKTLKITRPSGLGVRPSGKFGVNKPAAPAAPAAKPAAPAAGGDVADIPDIPDMPAVAALPPAGASGDTVPDVPAALGLIGVIVQVAACAVIGALAWFLYQDAQIPLF